MRGEAVNNGNSVYNGPGAPVWLRDWQFREAWEARTSIWDFLE